MIAVSGFDDVTSKDDYLDLSSLTEGVMYTKVAYVTNVTTGFQKNEYGFVTFYLKDVNANLVQARLFNVADFMLSGVKAATMKNHPVQLTFMVQDYNGRHSLVIDGKAGIELWDGDFPYERFIGKIDVDSSAILAIGNKCCSDFILDNRWATTSFETIAQGRAGAFMKIFDMALSSLCGMHDLPGVDLNELLFVYYKSMELYFDTLVETQKLDNFGSLNNYKFLIRAENLYSDDDRKMLIIDTTKALLSISKPVGIIAYAINNAVREAIFLLNASCQLNIAPIGTKVGIGGVDILKY